MKTDTLPKSSSTIKKNHVSCNLCGKDDAQVVYQFERQVEADITESFHTTGDCISDETLVKCNHCGLMYFNPRVDQSLVIKGYENAHEETYVAQEKERMETFQENVKFLNRLYPQKGKILDIGAAAGYFVNAAANDGWQATGIEPNKWLVDYGTKKFRIDLRAGVLEDYQFEENTFDAITCWDVLEHVPDPKALLKECHRILKKDGIIVINYPYMNCPLIKLFKKKWWFFLSVHLYYFTWQTLSEMLSLTGFQPIKRKLHFQKLKLGYVLKRAEPVFPPLFKLAGAIIEFVGLRNIKVKYYASQANMVARKK